MVDKMILIRFYFLNFYNDIDGFALDEDAINISGYAISNLFKQPF